jgi:putative inorganic carbon (HCO3(-)) transporter
VVCLGVFTFLSWGIISQRVSVFGSSSWFVRTGSFQVAAEMIKRNPWLGVGANNYLAVAPQYVPFGVSKVFGDLIAHNLFYLVTAETGLVGLLVFLIVLWAIMAEGQKVARADDRLLSVIAIGTLGGIWALLAHGMFDWLFRYDPINTIFWFQVGLLIAIQNVMSRDNKINVSSQHIQPQHSPAIPAKLALRQ